MRSSRPHDRPSMPMERSPTKQYFRIISEASVMDLSPVTFSAQNHLTSELLRTL